MVMLEYNYGGCTAPCGSGSCWLYVYSDGYEKKHTNIQFNCAWIEEQKNAYIISQWPFNPSIDEAYINGVRYIPPTPQQRYGCVERVCTPRANGPYLESTCGGTCQLLPPDKNNNLIILAGLTVVAAGIAYYVLTTEKEGEEFDKTPSY